LLIRIGIDDVVICFSEELLAHWLDEANVLGAADGQAVERVVGDHGGHGGKRPAELTQDERGLILRATLNSHVHKSS